MGKWRTNSIANSIVYLKGIGASKLKEYPTTFSLLSGSAVVRNTNRLLYLSICLSGYISFVQMFPMALVCGNTYVIKPSEQDPGACMMLVRMAQEAGVPDGVVNVIHGTKDGMLNFATCLY